VSKGLFEEKKLSFVIVSKGLFEEEKNSFVIVLSEDDDGRKVMSIPHMTLWVRRAKKRGGVSQSTKR
jgi:hypothetical protein